MSASRTQTTTTSSSTAGPSGFRRLSAPPTNPASLEDEDLEEDEEEILRKAQEKVRRMKEKKAAAAAAVKQKAEEEAARRIAEEAREQAAAREERRRRMAEAATARSRRGSSPEETSGSCHMHAIHPIRFPARPGAAGLRNNYLVTDLLFRAFIEVLHGLVRSPRRPVVEIRREKGKGKGKAKAQPIDEDPDDGGDEDDEDDRAPCEQCRSKKIPCQMQAGKRSSIICKPCHDAKVRCSYSTRPITVKREGGSNPTGERLAVLESQMAQLLADNRQLREGQVKANTYHRHFNKKLDWLMIDAARRRKSPPKMPAGPSQLPKKWRRVMDSEEEEEEKIVEGEKDGEGEEEVEVEEEEGNEPAPKKAWSEKGKEREE
ncbi:hypothetical protein EV368DRAFT_89281 [Lentinula lateritia]|nr:hypothetical protein EV368DRAFT_89281 [Lentinula lateritia]